MELDTAAPDNGRHPLSDTFLLVHDHYVQRFASRQFHQIAPCIVCDLTKELNSTFYCCLY